MAPTAAWFPGAPLTFGWAALPLLLAACTGAQRAPDRPLSPGELDRFRGSQAAEQLGTEGWIVVEEKRIDLGGGPALEAIVVEGRLLQGPAPEELRVAIWRPARTGWELLSRSEPVAGSSVELLEVASCAEAATLLFAAVEEEPDQRRHRLLVFEGLPSLRKAMGVQRDVGVDSGGEFVVGAGGFVFRTDVDEERWRCSGGGYETVLPSSPSPG